MQDYIEVEFRTGRLGYYQNTSELPIQPEDLIIVEVERGDDIAQVVHLSINSPEITALVQGPRQYHIKRLATDDDIEKMGNLSYEEEKAAKTFMDILARYPFSMKLIDTVYQFDGNKLTFFFSAEDASTSGCLYANWPMSSKRASNCIKPLAGMKLNVWADLACAAINTVAAAF